MLLVDFVANFQQKQAVEVTIVAGQAYIVEEKKIPLLVVVVF